MAKRQQRRNRGQRGSAPGRLRIVAGNWRGRRLPVLDAEGLRPSSERVRETLFNWLMLWTPGKRCLDLFAGTGALGFEALSRGAASCLFVERNPAVAEQLRKNIETLGAITASLEVGNALDCIERLERGSIDLVFLDPPFADARLTELCRSLNDSGILAAGARVYIEAPRDAAEIELPDGWAWSKSAAAGNVRYGLVQS